ncbi:5-oxoprolinase subunit PxpB [Lutispora thermophila]|uniref:Sensor histidine kinase inhibitor, KipI family n=1 Tax=Lutispora thermophila DSM 19022 TaxID=1122184 RepID=A0A1M6GCU1_9FIRM|nr:5-oxoprolinase subunit PxpB [Lutispora thermophila]SHJ07757.1 sensor histidine kinase inhibitor, KipI family [Lutispora thermophila DSM 19022]
MYEKARFLPAGDKSLIIEFGDSISPEINKKIRDMYLAIEKSGLDGIIEMVPTYRSILVSYNPLNIIYEDLCHKLRELEDNLNDSGSEPAKVVEIPTIYGGDYGPDIEFVAQHNDLSVNEVIEIHSSRDYLIYMLGFTPGFPYLGGMSEKIETPRLKTPRTKIPAGSVGIAGKQTGIYPIDSPGGWQLIGRTPVKLFDPFAEPPVLLNPGDYVRFVPIDEKEYKYILKQVEENKFTVNIALLDK